MALVHLNFESECLGNNTDVSIILPDKPHGTTPENFYANGKKYPVLWLLHGTFGDYTDWVRKSSIERYATASGRGSARGTGPGTTCLTS